MRPRLLSAALAAALITAVSALAQDVPWFEANPAARREALARCHDDHRLATQLRRHCE